MNTTDLDGIWRVTTMGQAAPMNLLHDHKHIEDGRGHNVVLGRKWGYFTVDAGASDLTLNYDHPLNSRRLRHVRDILIPDGDGWEGSLSYRGRWKFNFRLDPAS